MTNEIKIAMVALIFQILEFAVCLWQIINATSVFYIVILLLVILSSFMLFLIWVKHRKLLRYVKFIEYLMNNDKHNFVLLPKIKMYIHRNKIINKMKIKKLDVTYNITRHSINPDQNDDLLLGDMVIKYEMLIENKCIPNEFNFVSGNDYSNLSPELRYRYGSRPDFQDMGDNCELVAPYWRGSLKRYSFRLERQFLSQEGDLIIEIEVSCKKAFVFDTIPRDTIICLPEVFSNNIDSINYYINLIDFEGINFYCDAYQINAEKGEFTTQKIGCKKQKGKNSFESYFYPNKLKGEKAYYLRVGTNRIDREISN